MCDGDMMVSSPNSHGRESTMKRILQSAACFSMLFYPVAGVAGVVVQQTGGDIGSDKPKQKTTIYIQGSKLRMDSDDPAGKKSSVIFDGDKQVMWIVDPSEGSYREMTAAQVQQMGDQMSSMMQQMQGQLAQMPPEQRKMMEDMMKSRM